ncbi:MAG: LytTR family DNA-binding domain-containing protein [Saprospiraceae bacterium]|nr:LytTR family DNA-binding domain-containing protein [Saprospiraceae bacterium]
MRVIIIEDETNVREGFIKLLATFCPEVEVVGVADSVETGLKMITETDFDLLFLDINLPDGSGFDLMYRLESIDFMLIFVTAYGKYAVDAFKLSAVDYLLKPVAPDLLKKAIEKARNSIQQSLSINRVQVLESNLSRPTDQDNKIILKDQDSMHLIQVKDIIYCFAEGSYTNFMLTEKRKIITSTNLKEYEQLLLPYNFLRCHHSYLVNLHHVVALKKQDGGYLETSDQSQLPISTRKKATIIEKIKNTFIN